MGMFDKTYGAKAYTPASLAAEAGQGVADLAGGAFGMEHKESAVINVMKTVNPDDLTSVIDGFKQILEIDPNAAQEYKDQMMPFVEARQQQIQVDTARAKTRQAKQHVPGDLEKRRNFLAKNIRANNPDMTDLEVNNLALKQAQAKDYAPSHVSRDESAKAYIKSAGSYYDKTEDVYKKGRDLGKLLELNDKIQPMALTGKISGSDIVTFGNKFLANLGLFEDRAADVEEFDSITMSYVNKEMQSAPGVQTDGDEARYVKTMASRANTPEGNKRILEYALEAAEDQKELRLLRSKWDIDNEDNLSLGQWNIIEDKFWKEKIAERKKGRPELSDEPVATKKKKYTDTDVANAMKKIQGQEPEVDLNPFQPTANSMMPKVSRKIERPPARDPSVSQLSSFLNTNYDVPMEAPGMLTQTEANTVDAFLAKQQMNRPVLEEIREVALAEAPTKTPTTPKEARVGGEDITTWKKVKGFRMTPAEKKEWFKFVGSIPVDANGQRPKGWSIPFKKKICKNRPECKL